MLALPSPCRRPWLRISRALCAIAACRDNAQNTVPSAREAPTRAKPGEEPKHTARLDAYRLGVALRASRAIGKDPQKNHRCCDAAQYEQPAKNDDEQRGV